MVFSDSRRLFREISHRRRVFSIPIASAGRYTFSASETFQTAPKIPHFSKKIISNTTVSRPDPVSKNPVATVTGGLSGKPLFNLSTNILKEMYILTRKEFGSPWDIKPHMTGIVYST